MQALTEGQENKLYDYKSFGTSDPIWKRNKTTETDKISIAAKWDMVRKTSALVLYPFSHSIK